MTAGRGRAAPRRVELTSWRRRQQFEFFRHHERPWFTLCADVDVGALAAHCAAPGGPSFFLATLWLSLRAVNESEELRTRVRGDEVVVYERVHCGSTVLMPDDTFVFAYFDFREQFSLFAETAAAELDRVRAGTGRLEPQPERDDLVHYSVIPWVAFSSFQHARRRGENDSVPRIVFGKRRRVGERQLMPVSIEVHHALVDGLHVGRFYERFERLLAAPEAL